MKQQRVPPRVLALSGCSIAALLIALGPLPRTQYRAVLSAAGLHCGALKLVETGAPNKRRRG